MKYLKSFYESVSFYKEDRYADNYQTYKFEVGKYHFICDFSRKSIDYRNSQVWIRNYRTVENGQRLLGDSNAVTVLSTLSNITLDFINDIKPNALLINHLTADKENNPQGLNLRDKANYRFLKGKLPNNYTIDYYRLGDYKNADVMCVIKEKDYEFEDYNPSISQCDINHN